MEPELRVDVEEVVATCESPNNGAGPLWCYGAPLVVRRGDAVTLSVMETGAGIPPLCNTRPRIFRKAGDGPWRLVWQPDGFREREPCPIVGFADGSLFVTVNPSTQPPGTMYGECDPHVLEIRDPAASRSPVRLCPEWGRGHRTDHSYRAVACDGRARRFILLCEDADRGEFRWSVCDGRRRWTPVRKLEFPIRACYPPVCLRGNEAHVLPVGDIVEPVEAWRAHKKRVTGQEWDYVFRRLFYARNADVLAGDFDPPVEIDTVEATGGHIQNLDLWVGPTGEVHALYRKQNTTPLIRDAFLKGVEMRTTLEHAILSRGKVVYRATLMDRGEKASGAYPAFARFHSPDGKRLLAVVAQVVTAPSGQRWENAVWPIYPRLGGPKLLGLKEPFRMFFTNTERGGSPPSATLDLFGTGDDGKVLRYARVRSVG